MFTLSFKTPVFINNFSIYHYISFTLANLILKEALFDAISILNFGTVVSEYIPFTNPETVKSPVVLTLSNCLGRRN
jgi:hypothetical protein